VHRGQRAAAGARAGEASLGHGGDAAVRHQHHVLAAELLLGTCVFFIYGRGERRERVSRAVPVARASILPALFVVMPAIPPLHRILPPRLLHLRYHLSPPFPPRSSPKKHAPSPAKSERVGGVGSDWFESGAREGGCVTHVDDNGGTAVGHLHLLRAACWKISAWKSQEYRPKFVRPIYFVDSWEPDRQTGQPELSCAATDEKNTFDTR
jgi:hypothetical protein